MTILSMLHTVKCAGFHYQQVMTLVAGLGIVASAEGLYNSPIYPMTLQVFYYQMLSISGCPGIKLCPCLFSLFLTFFRLIRY